ncbi:MAG: DUF4249 domain-containing protein [Chlorobi bacterium]|nr:DUF4249 domain-containing protein [Chlorobiota bacterium]
MNKINILSIISLFAIVSSFSSCTERIDIKLDSDRQRLVVEAIITDIPGNQYVKLTKTADYFSNEPPEGVSGAIIKINTSDNNIILAENDSVKGLYEFPFEYIGLQGNDYNMDIELNSEIGGQTHYTANTRMPYLAADVDSIEVLWNSHFEGWMVRLFALDPPSEDYYMFNGIRNGLLITDSIHKVNIANDKLFNGNYTNGVIVLVFDDNELVPGDTFSLVMSNITKDYASFVNEVQTEIQANEPLFSGPPANISTNISNGAIGWFTAYPSFFSSTIVKEKTEAKEQ